MLTGYLHPGYAKSLEEFGTPRELPQCRGWILERQIPGLSYRDAMGCYPVFACQDWSQLHVDLEGLKNELVTLSLVADPFGDFDLAYLQRCFDVVIPFKEHFVINLCQPINEIVSEHHHKYARKSLQQVQVEKCQNPIQHLDEWSDLYAALIERHNIDGLRAFSRDAFARQMNIPGVIMFRVLFQGITIGANIFYVQDDVAYGHLSAFNAQGYELGAPYAVKWAAIEYFIDNKLHWLNLGGGSGTSDKDMDGLSWFKKGWANGTRTAYFCGRIFDQNKYSEIMKEKGIVESDYFPPYRKDEFE